MYESRVVRASDGEQVKSSEFWVHNFGHLPSYGFFYLASWLFCMEVLFPFLSGFRYLTLDFSIFNTHLWAFNFKDFNLFMACVKLRGLVLPSIA